MYCTGFHVCEIKKKFNLFINLALYFSYIKDDWHPYTSEGASYAELRGPGDFRYFYGEAARAEKCAIWQY